MDDATVRLSKVAKIKIRHARLLLLSGDRTGAMAVLRTLEGLGVDGRATLETSFRCDRLSLENLRIRDCLVRRTRTWPSGAGRGGPAPVAIGCLGCQVGVELASRFRSFTPPPSTLPLSSLPKAQYEAKRRMGLTSHSHAEDPLLTAAGMTPDDATDWQG